MSSPPSKPSFFQWIMGVRANSPLPNTINKSVKELIDCPRCEELVREDDMHKRRRRGKTKISKYCKDCGKKGYRPTPIFNEDY